VSVTDRSRAGAGARAIVFAGTAVGLGVVAHVLGGGATPRLGLVLFLAVVCGVLWSAAAGAVEQTVPRLLAGVVAVQLALHVALLGQEHGGHHQAGAGHPLTTSALAGHLVASLALAWWLRTGERAVWSATRRLVGRLLAAAPWPRLAFVDRRAPTPFTRIVAPPPAGAVLLPARRGPPAPA
jgi:hypothetical protein